MKLVRDQSICQDHCDVCPLDLFICTTYGDRVVCTISESNECFDWLAAEAEKVAAMCHERALSIEC